MATTKVLKLVFLDSENKKKSINLKHTKEGLSEEAVKAAMQRVVDADAFESDIGVKKFVKIVGAHYYTTQSDVVFAEKNED